MSFGSYKMSRSTRSTVRMILWNHWLEVWVWSCKETTSKLHQSNKKWIQTGTQQSHLDALVWRRARGPGGFGQETMSRRIAQGEEKGHFVGGQDIVRAL
jgi:hypothetical protein